MWNIFQVICDFLISSFSPLLYFILIHSCPSPMPWPYFLSLSLLLSPSPSLRSYSLNFYTEWMLGHLTNPSRCFLSVQIWQTINDSNTQQAPLELRKHFKNVNCKWWYLKTLKWKLIRHIREMCVCIVRGGCLFLFKPFWFYGIGDCFLAPASSLCAVGSADLIYDVPSKIETLTVVGWSDLDHLFQF